jgi:hypothetical protein
VPIKEGRYLSHFSQRSKLWRIEGENPWLDEVSLKLLDQKEKPKL